MKVFSFCLYGTSEHYYKGLLENIRIIEEFFPDFSIYVYLGDCNPAWTLPENVTIIKTGKAGPINAWIRYKPLSFAEIGFVRDADSRITERDRWCIQRFLESSYSYHIIRDHYWHKSPIMAGMFGWKETYPVVINEDLSVSYGYDEQELTKMHPNIVQKTLVHTNIFALTGEHTERIEPAHKDVYDFIGNVYKDDGPEFKYMVDPVEQVRILQRYDQFSIIQFIIDSVDPVSIPYEQRCDFYDTCFRANYYLNDVEKCKYWLSQYEFAEITPSVVYNSGFLFQRMNKTIVATFDETRMPAENEVVIVYGTYPDWHLALPCSNKLYRHISLFEKMSHNVVEYDPVWDSIDTIYILNLEERVDRYYETLLSLAAVGAPLHRIHHYKAKRDGLPPYVGATKNHVDVVEHFCKSGKKHCLILEDDIQFIDKSSVVSAMRRLFSEPQDYNICFLSLSKYGRREPHNDLLGKTFQACTTSSAYILQSSTAESVYSILSDGLQKMMETGNHHTFCVDRYWSHLPNLMYFHKKLAFQRPSYSNLTRGVSAHLD